MQKKMSKNSKTMAKKSMATPKKSKAMPKKSMTMPKKRKEMPKKSKAMAKKNILLPKKKPDFNPWALEKEYGKKKKESKWVLLLGSSRGIGLLVFIVLSIIILSSFLYVTQKFKVRTVYVQGNKHYSNEEIQNMVMEGRLGDNSLYLSMKYREKGIENVPFVEKMDVEILAPDTIKIYVYEKALAGYVEYLGRNMYFDKDGIIVESSLEKTVGIPQVTGLDFGYVVLYKKLPIEKDTVFKLVLNITQVLNKYEIATDRIYFDSDYQITLYFGDAKAKIGNEDYLDEKVMKLKTILPELEGKKGILRMENYSEDMENITFELE